MSFFDDASLAFLPSGAAGKDGKAYSIKPTDGTGDFTFSRGSNLSATRISANGLIEKGRENLLLQSNNFGTTWGDDGGIIASGFEGYDGTNNAWKYTKTGQFDGTWQSGLSITGVHTISIYAKLPDGETDVNSLLFRIDYSGGNTNVVFSLTGDGVPSVGGNGIVADKINVGNGWFRCVLTLNQPTTKVNFRPSLGSSTSGTTGSIYIQDAQAEIGLAATEVIESGATTGKAGLLEDEPRFDYSGGATCPSLLLEPSRTNLVYQSEYLEGLQNVDLTYSIESQTNPSGNAFAYKLIATATSSRLNSNIGTQGNNFVFSGFFKGTGVATRLRFRNNQGSQVQYDIDASGNFSLNFEDAANDNYDIEDYGNGWYRIWFETTTASGGTDNYLQVYPDNDNGDGSVLVWGLQAEQGSYPTSYIPNHSGGTITRGADVCTGGGDSDSINSTEGVAFVECSFLAADVGENRDFYISDGTATNRIRIRFSSSDVVNFLVYNGSIQADINYTLPNPTNNNKIAVKWKANDFALWVNGTERGTDTSGTTFSTNTLDDVSFFTTYNQSQIFHSNVKQVVVFNEALSDSELATLTTL